MEIVRIYCIQDCNGLKYVGSTKQKLKRRLYHHKYYKYKNDCSSKKLDLDNCKIYTLEETDEENRKVREQYWIDTIECVNKYNTIFDKKEYHKQKYQENRDERIQYQKEYRQKNRDKINKRDRKVYMKEYNKEYYQENKDEILEYQKEYEKKNRDKRNEYRRKRDQYIKTWGGNPRYNNNLLVIDLSIFN